jgi:hypothetical protein
VQDFLRLVHAFMTSGTCSANPGETIPRKRQSPSLLQPDSTFMATKLAPLLYDYARSGINSQYIQPFQKTWDNERNVNGGFLPTFGELASGVSDYNPVDGDAIIYLSDLLCYGKFSPARPSAATPRRRPNCASKWGGRS